MSLHVSGSRAEETVLVLWGDRGEESAAVIFVTVLRALGLNVKMVGIGGRRMKGEWGLTLVPDLTLSQALLLARSASCIVLPFAGEALCRFTTDPRLQQLVNEAHAHEAVFIQSERTAEAANLSTLFGEEMMYRILIYPQDEAIYQFVHRLWG